MMSMEGRLSCIWWHIEIPCISIPQKWTCSGKGLHSAVGNYIRCGVSAIILLRFQALRNGTVSLD